jgi:PAT family beta-lactamase induction signal transducer AmpG
VATAEPGSAIAGEPSVLPAWWPGWARDLEVYLDRRIVTVLFLGFASGLPLLLILRTLSAWLAEAGVDTTTIGLFGFVMAPYSFKFAWAPIMDRLPLPWLTRTFGRRRGWLLATQLGLIAAIFGLGQTDPARDLALTALMAFLVAFCSASQDVVIDAFRIELLREEQQAAGAANFVTGYRIGMWVAGAGALYLADAAGWSAAYAAMALLVLVGSATVLLTPEPAPAEVAAPAAAQADGRRWPLWRHLILAGALGALVSLLAGEAAGGAGHDPWRAGLLAGLLTAGLLTAVLAQIERLPALRQAVLDPFRDFLGRNGVAVALVILAFISLFKASDVLLTLIANPFYLEIGFTKSQIAWVSGTFGFFVTFVGAYLAGLLIYRIGILAGLWISGILMMASNLMFALQAQAGAHYPLFHATILIENLSGGMGTTAFVAYLASLCNRHYTAVQYALLTSFMQILAKFVIVPSSGYLADSLGWVSFFLLSSLAGLPALALLWWLGRHATPAEPAPIAAR